MVKPLAFKGDKKAKKRKHREVADGITDNSALSRPDPTEDDSWTSPAEAGELTGPVVIVLPTAPPTCLASDVLGNVFASPVENMVEGDPKTAEPHNVQQVWVASRVAGMASTEINFKASHGGYLSCDQYGILGAKREARGREESFTIDSTSDENERVWFQLRSAAASKSTKTEDWRYLSATTKDAAGRDPDQTNDEGGRKKVSVTLRGDGEAVSADTFVILRMQTKFKPQSHESKEASQGREKVSRKELETAAGRPLTDEEAKRLKKAKREGSYNSAILDVRAKGKHDKYA